MPLISFDDACWFRSLGTEALDRVNRPWRVALTSSSLDPAAERLAVIITNEVRAMMELA